jgi:hydroxyacylglutathione hydrolase
MENKFSSVEIRTQNADMINYTYLIIDNASKKAVIIDPAWELDKVINAIKENDVELKSILLTHCHNDHVNLVEKLVEKFNVQVYISKEESLFYEYKAQNLNLLEDNDVVIVGNTRIKCILTPGHTYGSMCFLVEDEEIFTGDTLFIEGCGRCDLFGSSAEKMFNSIDKIKKTVNQRARVYPGHSYGFDRGISLANLMNINIYYSIESKESFINFRMRINQNTKNVFS